MHARLDKVIIFCSNVERLVRFYQENLGLRIFGAFDSHWTVLEAGSTQLAFHKIGEHFLESSVKPFQVETNVKLVFEIDEDLDTLRQRLLLKAVDLDEIKRFPGATYQVCDGRDPEGNVFQLWKNDL